MEAFWGAWEAGRLLGREEVEGGCWVAGVDILGVRWLSQLSLGLLSLLSNRW